MAQKMIASVAIVLFFGVASLPALAETECIGDGEYRVCTDSFTDAQGNVRIRSYDTEGNSYSVGTETRSFSGGGQEIISRDSEGNSYSVKSWSDSSGVHSQDSEGNSCTITTFGTIIGCGQ